MANKFQAFCECGFKQITHDPDAEGWYEYQTTPIQVGVPKMTPEGKTIQFKPFEQPRKFRCPKCGHMFALKKIKRKNDENRPA